MPLQKAKKKKIAKTKKNVAESFKSLSTESQNDERTLYFVSKKR